MNKFRIGASFTAVLFYCSACAPLNTILINETGLDIYIEIDESKAAAVYGKIDSGTKLALEEEIKNIKSIRYKYVENRKETLCILNREDIDKLYFKVEGRQHLNLNKC